MSMPPLYLVSPLKKTEKAQYLYDERALTEYQKKHGTEGYDLKRFKGLGEMNPEQLWETTLDPEVRTLLKVSMEDASYADKMFNILMGDKVEPRRRFIEENANYVRNLDI